MKEFIILFVFIGSSTCFFDPVTIGTVAGIGAWLYNFDTVKQNTYCRFTECCTENYIPADIDGLKRQLQENLFGQHIVIKQLIPALRSHFINGDSSKKPLVISFHGTPGTGKNYVADYITKSLYKNGLKSRYVHKFVGRSDFPVEAQSYMYKAIINDKVRKAVSDCERSLFIFDEVDKMPPGVFESITSLLDHHAYLDGVNYRKSIFIFLSNTAGIEIAQQLGELMLKGVLREDTGIEHFEKILELGAYNLDGGLQKASIIDSHLIDHYIPFLPLEKQHVEKCVRAEFMRLGHWNPSTVSVRNIVDNYVTFDKRTGLFATTGCKRLSKKVEVEVHG